MNLENTSLDELQAALHKWRLEQFDPKTITPLHQLIGMQEELGELSHAVLKYEQKIRGMDDEIAFVADATDAIGDLCIFLMGFCSLHGWSLETLIKSVGLQVLKRNWKENPQTGDSALRDPNGSVAQDSTEDVSGKA